MPQTCKEDRPVFLPGGGEESFGMESAYGPSQGPQPSRVDRVREPPRKHGCPVGLEPSGECALRAGEHPDVVAGAAHRQGKRAQVAFGPPGAGARADEKDPESTAKRSCRTRHSTRIHISKVPISGAAATGRILVALLLFAACRPPDGPGEQVLDTWEPERVADPHAVEVAVLAHPDDDLVFMNPDLSAAVSAGSAVTLVYLTAGDAGRDSRYWREREEGVRLAYAEMAGLSSVWETERKLLAGRTVDLQRLVGARVTVVFLRLPDGGIRGDGYAATGAASLAKLWTGALERLSTVDGVSSYSAEDLVALLSALMQEERATRLSTLDGTGFFGTLFSIHTDHSDHYYSAKFGEAAVAPAMGIQERWRYRGYNTAIDAANLSDSVRRAKSGVFLTYAVHDQAICQKRTGCHPDAFYERWMARRHYAQTDPFPPGSLVDGHFLCLTATGSHPGGRLRLEICRGGPEQEWTFGTDGTLRGPGDLCTTAHGSRAVEGTPVETVQCDGRAGQSWRLSSAGHVVRLGGCLGLPEGSHPHHVRGEQVVLTHCRTSRDVYWTWH